LHVSPKYLADVSFWREHATGDVPRETHGRTVRARLAASACPLVSTVRVFAAAELTTLKRLGRALGGSVSRVVLREKKISALHAPFPLSLRSPDVVRNLQEISQIAEL